MFYDYRGQSKLDRQNRRLECEETDGIPIEFIDYTYMKALTNSRKLFQGCFVCGYDEHAQALEYHHLDSTKKNFNIATWSRTAHNEEEIHREMDKCVVLCSNCHRVIHSFMGQKI